MSVSTGSPPIDISVIFPLYNEEALVKANTESLLDHLRSGSHRFEILLCDNESTDGTARAAKKLESSNTEIRYVHVPSKGMGLGMKGGIDEARFDFLFIYDIDLPFGLKVIDDSCAAAEGLDIVIGSKRLRESQNSHSFGRNCLSISYNRLVNLFFHLDIKDTQGSLFFSREAVLPFLDRLDSKDAFFKTQVIIYGRASGCRVGEIPVEYRQQRRESKINPFRDGVSMFSQTMSEFIKLRRFLKNTP